jgi:DNA-binding NarL/FixJ family response regulator
VIRTFVSARSLLAREGLAAIVRGDARLELAGSGDVDDVERAIVDANADVLLSGDRTRDRQSDLPTVAIVDDPQDAWSRATFDDERSGFALLGNDASPGEIVAAIVAVAAGLVAVQPRTLARDDAPRGVTERLTPRERDVLGELARGVPNKTIAADLGISEHTVKFHVASIFAKLGAASRTEAVAQGVRHGLIML